jgi:hypothetical protein
MDAADHHDDGENENEDSIGTTSSALVAADPVSAAVAQSCSTTAVKALATQLVEEIQCMKPGSMKRIDNTPGLSLGSAVFPYIQTGAANALINAQKARGVTMTINSGLRTLPQQYLLYRWYQTGRCGIGLAASPGTSNHESGIALDINDNGAWQSAMTGKSFKWLGANDPVHFDFVGSGTINMKGLSVLAFQKLWNRNNPNDKIPEDSEYGPSTEQRLAKSPVGGFPIGAICTQSSPPPGNTDPGASTDPSTTGPAPNGGEDADKEPGEKSGNSGSEGETKGANVNAPRMGGVNQGCSAAPAQAHRRDSSGAIFAIAIAALLVSRRRRQAHEEREPQNESER